MTTHTPSRRTLLAAAVAAPAAAVGIPLLAHSAAAATAQGGFVSVVDWSNIALAAGVTAAAGEPPQARVVSIAGTEYLQLRGRISCDFATDSQLGNLPAAIQPPKMVRGVCPRNNNLGINSTRVEADTAGRVMVYGPQATNKVTWVQLDSFSSVLR
ncbi:MULTISPECIES: hypothetical protein [unclassified Streptomyces]|uniref:hypothetical protein n=1 Tax=unclassified Streptomyces TaxID=2593676 RepID=UPI00225080A2|nr:hypothetical protein [Streptomyces sp. NBC_00047]MCX5612562.1 hypothetical protein [Streptomyces sp. NBC_00047]